MVMENAVYMLEKDMFGRDFDLFFRQYRTKNSFRIVEGIQLNDTF